MASARPRRLLRLLAWTAAALLLIVALLPTILSAGIARSYLADALTEEFGEAVEVGSVDLGWFSGAAAGGIRAGTLLSLRDGRVEGSLWSILFGEERLRVAASGIQLSVEEGAGGRTNLEPLLERLTRPREVVERPPRKPRALQINLTDCAITLRRTPRTPQNPPVDPFVEDPVVLPADANATVIALAGIALDASLDGTRASATFSASASVNGRTGTLSGKATRDGDILTAEFDTAGIDLEPLGLPLAGVVACKGSVRVEGGRTSGRLAARVGGASAFGFAEEWVTVEVEGERAGDAVRVGTCKLATASGEISLEASGSLPDRVAAKGRFPMRLAAMALDRPQEPGVVDFDLRAASRGQVYDLAGSVGLRGFSGPDLAANLDVTIAPEARSLEIRVLEARAPDVELHARGKAAGGERPSADLTLAGEADLAKLRRYLGPLVTLPAEMRLEGRAHVGAARFVLGEGGDALVDLQAEIGGLVAGAIARDRVVLSIDASLENGGDRVVVRRGEIDRLAIAGSAEGLREGRLTRAEGSIRGTVDLDPALLRLAGVSGVEALAGHVEIDLTARTSPAEGVLFAGEVKGRSMHVRAAGVDLRQESIALRADGVLAGNVASGKATVGADAFSLEIDGARFAGLDDAEARGRIVARDLAALRALLPRGTVPDSVELEGGLAGPFELTLRRGRQEIRTTLESQRLTARVGGRGVASEPVRLRLHAGREGASLELTDSAVALGARAVEVVVRSARVPDLAQPDRGLAELDVSGPLEGLSRLHAEIERLQPRGQAALRVQLSRQQELAATVHGTVRGFFLQPSEKLSLRGDLKLEATAHREESDLHLDTMEVTLGETRIHAKGRVGRLTDLRLRVTGDGSRLAQILPGASAEGPVDVDLVVKGALGGGTPLNATGRFTCKRIALPSLALASPAGEIRAEARLTSAGISDLASTALIRAPEARLGTVRVERAEVSYTGATEAGGGPLDFRMRVTADRLVAGELPVERIDLSLAGTLPTLDAKAIDDLALTGQVSFEKASAKTLEITRGSALIEMRRGVAFLREFTARANGGTVAGDLEVAFREDPISWKAKVGIADLQIREAQGRALSFTVPFLRLASALKDATSLEGLLAAHLDVTGKGTDGPAIARSLGGKGTLQFKDVSVRGSLLLPLLNLRIDQLLSREPYRFQDLDLAFAVRDGRVLTPAYELKGMPFSIHVEGNAGLDGSLDYLVRPSLLPFPLRISGTLDRPKVRPAPLAGLR